MELIKKAHDNGFDGTEVELDGKRPMKVRAVLLDENDCMALMYLPKYKHNGNKDLYMIPGGGVDNSEDLTKALYREILEETGCHINIIDEIGYIVNTEAEDIWTAVTYYYIAKVVGEKGQLQLTEHESDSQFELQWHKLEEALNIIENQAEDNCKIVKFRDKLVVEEAIKSIKNSKMLNGKIAVFFDADGTLVDHKACEKQALQYVFEELNLRYDKTYQGTFRAIESELWANAESGLIPHDNIFTKRFERLFEAINVGYNDYFHANELFKKGLATSNALLNGAEEIAAHLQSKGFILCVLTNGLVELQRPRVMNSPVGKYISHIIVSEEVGAHKPNPLIFNTMLKRIGLNANDVIMIGDSLQNDIQGAINVGIQSVWLNLDGVKNTTGIQPDYEINSLLELKN